MLLYPLNCSGRASARTERSCTILNANLVEDYWAVKFYKTTDLLRPFLLASYIAASTRLKIDSAL